MRPLCKAYCIRFTSGWVEFYPCWWKSQCERKPNKKTRPYAARRVKKNSQNQTAKKPAILGAECDFLSTKSHFSANCCTIGAIAQKRLLHKIDTCVNACPNITKIQKANCKNGQFLRVCRHMRKTCTRIALHICI